MVLTVILVNYNVKYFLEQCLHSVEKSLQKIEAEIIVVDNHSTDGSLEYLQPRFPRVQFLVNGENKGFGRANNQALEQALGKYILFLNPDTIVPEDICSVCLSFFESVQGAGAAGVRMVDGRGCFLPESRRGYPSPWVAFCKLTGLTGLFPQSRVFARYYLGYLPADEDHRAPVLSGACLWVRKQALDQAGNFDERFFMYAEDIDLSYRIERAGYDNYYLAGPAIIHFKGESTLKDARYIKLFYKAMSQFRRKYSGGGLSGIVNLPMETAIWARAGLTAIARLFRHKRGAGLEEEARELSGCRTFLRGDPDGVDRLKWVLSSRPGRELVSDPGLADEIIFCEGAAFSFKEIIKCLRDGSRQESRVRYKFHAGGSDAAVGSHSKEGKGEVIIVGTGRASEGEMENKCN
jgi:N-acetylglucosaminyl-diphospho-decaprenol L-rhamnosyltransferase